MMKSNLNRLLEGTGTTGSKAYFEESIQESVFEGLPAPAPGSVSQAPQGEHFCCSASHLRNKETMD